MHRPAVFFQAALIFVFVITSTAAAEKQPGTKSDPVKSVGEIILGTDPVGNPLPDFTGVTISGEEVDSSEMRGTVLLINLWGINCWSCLEEMKALQTFYPELRDKGFEVWAVNSDKLGPEQIIEGLKKKNIIVAYPVLPDLGLIITGKFTTTYVPVSVIVNKEGIVRFYKIGFKSSDIEEIRGKIEELLN